MQVEVGVSEKKQKDLGVRKPKKLTLDYQFWNEGAAFSNHKNLSNRPKINKLMIELEKETLKLFFTTWAVCDEVTRRSLPLKNAIIKNGVIIYNKDGTYELNNSTDKLMKQLLDGVAEYNNANRAERTGLGKLNKVQNDGWTVS